MIQAYPRLYFWAAVFAVLVVIAVFFGIPIAHAQTAAPAAPPVGAEGIIGLIRDSFTAALVAVVSLIATYLSPKLPSWLAAIIDRYTTSEAATWEGYVTDASHSAFDYASAKLGLTPDKIATYEQRSDFLGYALNFLEAHHDDIVSFADKNGNGVIDILESRLAKLAPNMPAAPVVARPAPAPIEPEPMAAAQVQGLMSGPVRRGVTTKPQALIDAEKIAAKYAPKAGPKLSGARAMGSA